MAQRIVAWLVNTFWGVIAASIILVGLVVSLGRYYLPLIDSVREEVETQLSQLLAAPVTSSSLIGSWHGINPIVGIRDLAVGESDTGAHVLRLLSVTEAQIEVDLLRSIVARSPVYREAIVSGLQLHLYQRESGAWYSPLFHGGGRGVDIARLYDAAHDLRVINTQLVFHHADQVNVISLANFSLERGQNLTQTMLSVVDDINAEPMAVVVETRGLLAGEEFSLSAYLHADNVDLSPYRFLSSQLLHSDHASLELWASWRKGQALEIYGAVAATNFAIGPLPDIAKATANIGVQYQAEGVAIFATQLQFELNQQTLSLPDLRVDVDAQTNAVLLSIPALDLSQAQPLYSLVPARQQVLQQALTDLQPAGYLRNIALNLKPSDNGWQFALAADADELSLASWRGAPAVTGASGRLQQHGALGRFSSNGDDFSLHFNELYDQPFKLQQVQGEVGWQLGEYITVGAMNLTARTHYGRFSGSFSLDLPSPNVTDRLVPNLSLAIRAEDLDAAEVNNLIPTLSDTAVLKQWLEQADLQGDVPLAQLFINTSISKQQRWFPALHVAARGDQLNVGIGPQWPRIQTLAPSLLLSHRQLSAFNAKAKFLAIDVAPATVTVAIGGRSADVSVKAKGLGPITSAVHLFQHTPLAQSIQHGLDGWVGDGDFSAALDLGFSIDQPAAVKVRVDASIIDASLHLPSANLAFTQVQGMVQFDDGKLSSTQLSANILDAPWQLTLANDKASGGYVIAGKGHTDMTKLADWLEQPLLLFLEGSTDVSGRLQLSNKARPQLTLTSDLRGVRVDLPPPFAKPPPLSMPTTVNVLLAPELELAVHNPLATVQAYIGVQPRGVAALGQLKQLPAMPAAGFVIGGALADVSANEALDTFNRYLRLSERYSVAGSPVSIRAQDIHIERLLLADQFIAAPVLNAHNNGDNWNANITAPSFNAGLTWSAGRPLAVAVKHLDYPFTALSEAESKASAPWRPSDLPAMTVTIDKFNYHGADYGRWRFDIEPRAHAVAFTNISGLFNNMAIGGFSEKFPATLTWRQTPQGDHVTTLQASVSSGDVRQVFTAYDLEPSLTSKQALALVTLGWPYEPFNFDPLQVSGAINFALTDGQFLRTEGAPTGLLKLLGVFNFDNLVRRMRLDFGDLMHEGLSYDKFSGGLSLVPGQVSLRTPLIVDGPSSDFRMTGSLDLNAQTINGELVAVVPVSRNLPWLAALAGGLPAAAGVYLASKVFADGFDRLSSASYSITGPWAEPEVKFERLFDDKNRPIKLEPPASGAAAPAPALAPPPKTIAPNSLAPTTSAPANTAKPAQASE